MDSKEFIIECDIVAKWICDYLDNLDSKSVSCKVSPGFLEHLKDEGVPEKGEKFSQVFEEMKEVIMPGVVHWAHPHFHGYLPSSHAYPSILAEMLSAAEGAMGFSWIAGPAMAELEVRMTDWLGYALGLPSQFFNFSSSDVNGGGGGGGIMATSATECSLTTLLAARHHALSRLVKDESDDEKLRNLQKLVAYCSNEAHSCIEKAAKVAMVELRVLATDSEQRLDPQLLKEAMEKDEANGLHPCYVFCTLGTSSSGAFDQLNEIAEVARAFPGVWLHVNAAYGGNMFICPEFRQPLEGIHLADSICVNPYKGLLINTDSTVLWVRNREVYCSALTIDPVYLAHSQSDKFLDHRHWSLWLSRRFRSLKIWFTFRLYGVQGLRNHVRKMMEAARAFAALVQDDDRFEICNQVLTPLVCFRLKGPEGLNHELLAVINGRNKILMTPAILNGKFVLRFVVAHEKTDIQMVEEAFNEIQTVADDLLEPKRVVLSPEKEFRRLSFTRRVSFMDYRMRNPKMSLKEIGEPVLVPVMMDQEEQQE